MDVKNVYNELNEMLCNQDKALKELVWTIEQNKKLKRPKNALLVGSFGSGKTTMVELTAEKMGVPLVSVYGSCTSGGFNPKVFYDAFIKLYIDNKREGCQGIVLIQDMRDCLIYGGFSDISSFITSGSYNYQNRIIDISKTMFIGEIDDNNFEDCFIPKPVYTLENLDEAFLMEDFDKDEVKNILEELVLFNCDIENAIDVYSPQYRAALRRLFLSADCTKIFNKKIFMECMQTENIQAALNSPISELNVYKDDLCEEYIESPHFINSVAAHIRESMVGLHDLDEAVRDTARFDSQRKIKVYKENSLLRL